MRYFATKKIYDQQIEELKHAADDGIGNLSTLERAQRDVGSTLSSFRRNVLLPKMQNALNTIATLENFSLNAEEKEDGFLSAYGIQNVNIRCVSAALSLFREAQQRNHTRESSSSEPSSFDLVLTRLFAATGQDEVDHQVNTILTNLSGQESQIIAALNRKRSKACLSSHCGLKGLAEICHALFRSFRTVPNKESTPAVLIMLAQTSYVDGTKDEFGQGETSDDDDSETRRRARRIYLKHELRGSGPLDDRVWAHSILT